MRVSVTDNTMAYQGIAESQNVSPSDGWTQLTGDFTVEGNVFNSLSI